MARCGEQAKRKPASDGRLSLVASGGDEGGLAPACLRAFCAHLISGYPSRIQVGIPPTHACQLFEGGATAAAGHNIRAALRHLFESYVQR